MKSVIYGLAKSGTTALFYKLKNSLPPDTVCLFEPRSFDPRALKPRGIRALFNRGRKPDVLAKVLPFCPGAPADAEALAATFPRDHFKTIRGYDGEKGYEYEARARRDERGAALAD